MTPGALPALLLAVHFAVGHPTHTSTAELAARGDSIHVTIRMFEEDLAGVGDVRPYVAERFAIEDTRGVPAPLEWAGSRRSGDMLVVTLRGRMVEGLAGAVVRHEVLMERFADQVNVVRATYRGRAATLVFIRGDRPKALP